MALTANELRIGNWVLDPSYKLPIKLDIDAMEVLLGARHFDYLEPITITPEILEKWGFVKTINGYIHPEQHFYFDNELVFVIEYGNGYYDNPPCKHLHQLQNLYFALTGQELNIEL